MYMVHQSKVSGNWERTQLELHVLKILADDVSSYRAY